MRNLIIVLVLFAVTACHAQQQTITYSMKMENNPAAAMMGDMQITLYYKNGKSLTNMGSQMVSTKTLVTDSGSVTLMSAMGQKFFFKTPALSSSNPKYKKPTIQYTNQKKQIAGYTCTKALVFMQPSNGKGADTAVFWYTEKLPVVAFGKEAELFKGLKGMPLAYEINASAMKLTMVAQNVSTAPIPDSIFALSTKGYQEMNPNMVKQFRQ